MHMLLIPDSKAGDQNLSPPGWGLSPKTPLPPTNRLSPQAPRLGFLKAVCPGCTGLMMGPVHSILLVPSIAGMPRPTPPTPTPRHTYAPHPLQGPGSTRQLFCGLHSCLNRPSGLWYQSGPPARVRVLRGLGNPSVCMGDVLSHVCLLPVFTLVSGSAGVRCVWSSFAGGCEDIILGLSPLLPQTPGNWDDPWGPSMGEVGL